MMDKKDRDEYLRNSTYKGGKFTVAQRVLTTLLDVGEQRRAKAFAWLVTHLHTEGKLSDGDVDELLWATRERDD